MLRGNIDDDTIDAFLDSATHSSERFNDPGKFTALIGYKRTSLIKGNNMHRVVVFRDGGKRELFHLSADVSERNDRAATETQLAGKLHQQWLSWNRSNVASRLDNYKKYHLERDQFFLKSISEKATSQVYAPTPIPTFK